MKYVCQDCKQVSKWSLKERSRASGIHCLACGSRALDVTKQGRAYLTKKHDMALAASVGRLAIRIA